ncbi:hypothetical protein BH10PSE13_BH10PSE13_15450 [soil metagenome]
MPDVLLTLYCATADADSLIDALRTVTRTPLHMRIETVHGRDFRDAGASEQVTATLDRSAIECVEDEAAITTILETAAAARRRSPLRWHMTPVIARGRIP